VVHLTIKLSLQYVGKLARPTFHKISDHGVSRLVCANLVTIKLWVDLKLTVLITTMFHWPNNCWVIPR